MKTVNRILLFALAAALFTGCAPLATASPVVETNYPYSPQPGDSALQRDEVTIDSASLTLAESEPIQVTLNFAYFQPTPCHQLRVEVSRPDPHNRINISAYALTEKDKACTLMALATPLDASLNLGTFPSGHYNVWLNDAMVGEFDS